MVACGGSTVSSSATDGGGSGGSGGDAGDSGGSGGACPPAAPFSGTPCASEGTACTYPDQVCTDVTCLCGSWRWLNNAKCNLPPPQCPTTAPTTGTPCMDEGFQCTYSTDPNGCCPPAQATCSCGVWQTSVSTCNPPPPACPVGIPQNGASCASSDPCAVKVYDCNWGDCGNGVPIATGSCDGKLWTVMPNCVAGGDAGDGG